MTNKIFNYSQYDETTDTIKIKDSSDKTVVVIAFDENGNFTYLADNKENIEALKSLLKESKKMINCDIQTEYNDPYDIAENLNTLFSK